MFVIIVVIIDYYSYMIRGCGIQSESCFGWKTFDREFAGTGHDMDVRFLFENNIDYSWTEYYNDLNNNDCDDHKRNNIDWYSNVVCPSNIVAVGIRMNSGYDGWLCDTIYINNIVIDTFYDINNNELDGIWLDYDVNARNNSEIYYAIDMTGKILSNNESYIITKSQTNYPTIKPTLNPTKLSSINPTMNPIITPSPTESPLNPNTYASVSALVPINLHKDSTINLIIITVIITSSICCICWVCILILKQCILNRNKLKNNNMKHNKNLDDHIATINIINHSSINNAIELVTDKHVKESTFDDILEHQRTSEGGIARPSRDTKTRHIRGELSLGSELYIPSNTSNTSNKTMDGDV